jgi:hypothetical protein
LSTHRNCTSKKRVGHSLQNEHEVASRTFPLAPLLAVVLEQSQCIASLRILDAPGEYTCLQQLLEFRVAAPLTGSLAPAERKAGGVNPVRIHQCEGPSRVRLGTPFTIVAESDGGVGHNPTEAMLLEEALLFVPNERPLCGHVAVFIEPALGTQKFSLHAFSARDLPKPRLFTATTLSKQLGVGMQGEEDLEENGFLSP